MKLHNYNHILSDPDRDLRVYLCERSERYVDTLTIYVPSIYFTVLYVARRSIEKSVNS